MDYLVDEICYILKYIKRSNESDSQEYLLNTTSSTKPTSTTGVIDSQYDDRIIRVVGAVFFDLQSISPENYNQKDGVETDNDLSNDENFQDITMHLRDLIKDSLDVVDILCNSSTSYAEILSQDIIFQIEPEQIIQYRKGQV